MNLPQTLNQQIVAAKSRKVKNYPCHVNRASQIGHPCERYLVLSRSRWQDKMMHEADLQFIFDLGNLYETAILKDFAEAEIVIIEQQRAFEWKEYQLTGHIDGKVLHEGRAIPAELKSTSPYVWMSINSIQDMVESKYAYLQAYPGQMDCYLLMDNKDYGLWFLKNKVNGQYKVLEHHLDWDRAELLIRKAERINEHVKNDTLPEHINDAGICMRCGFRHICLPDMGDIEQMEGRLINLLDERADIRKIVEASPVPKLQKRMTEVNDMLKKILEGKESVMVGTYFITGSWRKSGHGSRYWHFDVA